MTAGAEGDGLAAALIQISAHAERISGLDAREAGHYEQIAARLRELAAEAASASTRIDGIGGTLDRQAAIIDALDGLDGQVAALARQLAELADEDEDRDGDDGRGGVRYRSAAAPRWWKLTPAEREAAVDRLRAWVEQVYRPGYGKLAAALPPCWERHPLCLYVLDWLSELWSVLYLAPRREGGTLAAQGEWQTRLLPAAAEQMAHEAVGCQHAAATWQQPRRPAPGPAGPGNGTRSGP
jgi:hypothetical protein